MWLADAIFALLLLLSAASGLRKGIIMGVAGMVGLIAGVYLAVRFSDLLCELLYLKLHWENALLPVVSFLILFCIALGLMLLGGKLMEGSMKAVQMDWLNRLLGALFGLLKGVFVLSLMLYMFQKIDVLPAKPAEDSMFSDSYLYKPLSTVAVTVMPVIEDVDYLRWKERAEQTARTVEDAVREEIKN